MMEFRWDSIQAVNSGVNWPRQSRIGGLLRVWLTTSSFWRLRVFISASRKDEGSENCTRQALHERSAAVAKPSRSSYAFTKRWENLQTSPCSDALRLVSATQPLSVA
jgi:hypothetical protein